MCASSCKEYGVHDNPTHKHTHIVQMPSEDTHSRAHKNTHSTIPVWSRLCLPGLEQIMGGKSTVGFWSCQWHCVSPASTSTKTHTFALPPPPLLKQHREQGLWIINTPKFPHDSGQRCPSSKRCWCVEEESHGRSPDEYKIHVQTQCRNRTGGLRGSELGRQSKRASGLKLQTSCVHTDNWHACRRCCNCKISKKKKKKGWEYFLGEIWRETVWWEYS